MLPGRLLEPRSGVRTRQFLLGAARYRCTQLCTTDASAIHKTYLDRQTRQTRQRIRTILPPRRGSVVPGRGSRSRTSPQMKDPRRGTSTEGDPYPRISETTNLDANSKRLYWIHGYPGQLSLSEAKCPEPRERGPFIAKSILQKQKPSYRDFIGQFK